jgi:prolipoprotein diacylglyceryltransferase
MSGAAVTISYPPLHSIFGVSPHGILSMVGVLLGAALLLRQVRRRGGDPAVVENAILYAVPAGVLGARVDYVVSHPHEFSTLLDLVAVWRGGLALFGGLIAGLVVASLIVRRGGYHLPRLLDAAAPYFALAIAVGRIGDLLLLDHLGKPTSGGWALAYRIRAGSVLAPGFEPSPAVPASGSESCAALGRFYAGCSYHLTPAYDLLGSLLLFGLLLGLRRWGRYPAGVAFGVWALWYGTQRLLLDFARGVDERPLLGLTGTQMLALIVISAAGICLIVLTLRHLNRAPNAPPPSAHGPLQARSADREQTDSGELR